MYVSQVTIKELEKIYGSPKTADFHIPVFQKEFDCIKKSQKHGRKHDATLYIFKDDKVIVIAKPFYPKGMYRAPSGGIKPKEDFVVGAKREAKEETGCEIEIEHFLLKTNVVFTLFPSNNQTIEWNSYIFQAKYISGDFQFTDKREIREVKLATLSEFESFSKLMRQSKIGGLHYRASLHDFVKNLLIM